MRRFLFILFIIIAVIRILFDKNDLPQNHQVRITSKIISQPQRFSANQYLRVLNLKVYLPLYPEISYGDKIVIEGKVVGDRLEEPKLIEIKKNDSFLYSLRSKIISFYKSSLPEPHASLIAGVVLGSKQDIPTEFMDSLKKTGVAHVVVASGMNVALVGGFLLNLLTQVTSRKKALAISLLGIWLYTFMCGLEAPLVRAATMGSIAYSAQFFGRVNNSGIKALLISALLMMIYKPSWIFDWGFILSFAATFSLILFQIKIDRLISFVPGIFRQDLSTTLAAQIGVAPIIYFVFGQFNIFSPFINVAVLWTVPLITVIGFLGGVVGVIVPELGRMLLLLAYPLTWWFNLVVDAFS